MKVAKCFMSIALAAGILACVSMLCMPEELRLSRLHQERASAGTCDTCGNNEGPLCTPITPPGTTVACASVPFDTWYIPDVDYPDHKHSYCAGAQCSAGAYRVKPGEVTNHNDKCKPPDDPVATCELDDGSQRTCTNQVTDTCSDIADANRNHTFQCSVYPCSPTRVVSLPHWVCDGKNWAATGSSYNGYVRCK